MPRQSCSGRRSKVINASSCWSKKSGKSRFWGKEDGDMDLNIDVDVSEAAIRSYKWYSAENYMQTMELIEKSRQSLGEKTITNEVLDETAKRLGK